VHDQEKMYQNADDRVEGTGRNKNVIGKAFLYWLLSSIQLHALTDNL
jgi:hypothetical protein